VIPAPAQPVDQAGVTDHVTDSVEAVVELYREHDNSASPLQRALDGLTGRLGRPAALIATLIVICAWVGAAIVRTEGHIEQPPFIWLELAATLSALVISLLILVTQRRDDQLAERRARLTLELALLADRKNAKIIALLEELRRDHPGLTDRVDEESEAMATPTDTKTVLAALDAQTAR
jgi:uncharacterized membrane protein